MASSPPEPTRVTGFGLTIPPGTRLNGVFEIERQIGAGGMGMVYRAHNVETGDKVAIKIVRAEMADNEQVLALFRKEAAVLHRLLHDAIVRYYLFTSDPQIGRPYLATEFVDGTSLAEMGAIARDDVLALAERLAGGLQAAHEFAIFHRDISPDNVILPERDVRKAKIIDFGIARAATLGGGTVIGDSIAGKFDYMSPEQLGLYGGQVDARSDIYSLGIVLAEAVLGRSLKMGGTQLEVVEKRRKVPDLSGIEPKLRGLIASMVQPRPEDRIASMADVAASARQLRTGVSVASSGKPFGKIAAAVAGLVVIGGGAAWFIVSQEGGPPPAPPAPPLVRQETVPTIPPSNARPQTDATTPSLARTGEQVETPAADTAAPSPAVEAAEQTGPAASDTAASEPAAPPDTQTEAATASPPAEDAAADTTPAPAGEDTAVAGNAPSASGPPVSPEEAERLGDLGEARLNAWIESLTKGSAGAEEAAPADTAPPAESEATTTAATAATPEETASGADTSAVPSEGETPPDDATSATAEPSATAGAAGTPDETAQSETPAPPLPGADEAAARAPVATDATAPAAVAETDTAGGEEAQAATSDATAPANTDTAAAAGAAAGEDTAASGQAGGTAVASTSATGASSAAASGDGDGGAATGSGEYQEASLGPQPSQRIEEEPTDPLIGFLRAADLGPCTYLQLVSHGPQSANIVAYGNTVPPFQRLDEDFKQELGFPADINLRPVADAQCPAIDLASALVKPGGDHLKLRMDTDAIEPGGLLSGAITGIGHRQLHLYLVAGDGHLYGLADMLSRHGDDATFRTIMAGTSAGAPQHLLVALAGSRLPNLPSRPQGSMASDLDTIRRIVAEDPDAEAAIGYFKYGN